MELWLLKLPPLGGKQNRAGLKRWGCGLSLQNIPAGCLAFGLLTIVCSQVLAENRAVASDATVVSSNRAVLDPTWEVGAWIWTTQTYNQQLCRLWRAFEIPRTAVVVKARLRIAADNSYELFLDGRKLGRGSFWRDLMEYDLTALLLKPGTHVLAVEAYNDFDAAGVLAGLHLELADGKVLEVASDASWRIVPNNRNGWEKMTQASKDWPPASVIQALGGGPWNKSLYLFKATQLPPTVVRFWQTGWFSITLFSFCVLVLAICIRLLGKLAFHVQANQVIRRERARIARDLHDDLTSGLTQMVLLGEIARNELPAESPSHQQVGRVCEKARNLSQSLNEIIWMVNSQRDTLRDFASYICKYAEKFMQSTAIRCRFELDETISDLPCDLGMRRNLFLAVKEALNNVVRHSAASQVILRIRQSDLLMVVAIEDNGKGFVPAEADRERNGLSNLMKRAADAGGICRIDSQPGSGCCIEFTVPLKRRVPGRFWQGWRQPENHPQSAASPVTLTPMNESPNLRL